MAESKFAITIARGFGSGGKEIAGLVAKEFGIHCYENRILTLASKNTGLDRTRFDEVDEKLRGGALVSALRAMPRTLHYLAVDKKFTSDLNLFKAQSDIIKSLYEYESFVVVGKCADFVLKGSPNVFSFYIEAPRAYCLKNTMERMGVNEEEASKIITKTDKYRADYYKYYTGGNYWTNPVNYDLTLNSDKVGKEGCVKVICDYVRMKLCGDG